MKLGLEEIVLGLFFGLLIMAVILFFGSWFLNLFGLINYTPPMSQELENIVQIDILDARKGEFSIIRSLAGDEIAPFMESFLKLDAGRYANDPPLDYGDWVIRICYADGGYDLLGGMVDFYSASGGSLPTKGMYYLHSDDLEEFLRNYLP